jgi:hypothetical protein
MGRFIINKKHWKHGHTERLHLLENSAADADVGGEGALLVDVSSLNGGLGGLEACNKVSLAETRPFGGGSYLPRPIFL